MTSSTDPLIGTLRSYDMGAAEYAMHSRDRAALSRLLVRFAELTGPDSLAMDLGCGPGHDAALLVAQGLQVIGCDATGGLLEEARSYEALAGRLLTGDARQLPLATASLGSIWACASLLHLSKTDVQAALREALRVLRPGGVLFTSMQHGSGEMVAYDPGFGLPMRYYFFYADWEWEGLLRHSGFKIIDQRVNPTTYGLTAGATGWIETFARKP